MVVKSLIEQNILDMFDILKEIKDSEEAKTKYASLLSDIIADAILSADVAIGIPVQVVPTSGTGTTTALGSLI